MAEKNGKYARRWLETLGEAEALAALGGLSHANPDWDFPGVEHEADCLEARRWATRFCRAMCG